MSYTEEHKRHAFAKTDGLCHLCGGLIVFEHYHTAHRTGWEMEHSRPYAKGGADHANNRYAAHRACNRSKQDRANRTVRKRFGMKRSPLSRKEKRAERWRRAGAGRAIGGVAAAILGLPLVATVVLVAVLGHLTGPQDNNHTA